MIAARLALLGPMLTLAGCQGEDQPADPAPSATATAAPAPAANRTPDVAACPERELLEQGLRERDKPIAVPAVLSPVMRSGVDNFAVVTLSGATVCVDASWMEAIRDAALSADGRFASFAWDGHEAFGHVIVDRSGDGQVLDTGVAPSASPSGALLAAADLSESGYGALNAFAVWRIEPSRIRQLAKQETVPPAHDWRIERWASQSCVELSSVPWETFAADSSGPREAYRARESGGWRLEPGRCGDG